MRIRNLLPLLVFLLPSCTLPSDAEKATCESISPEYSTYVEADTKLDDAEKNRRHTLNNTWRTRVGLQALPKTPSQLHYEATMAGAEAIGGAR